MATTKPTQWDHPDPNQRWFHRRMMAYSCMLAGLLYALLSGTEYVSPDIAGPFYLFVGSVVCVYTGYSAWETVRMK